MLSQLHDACVQGDLDVVQELHNGGASVNAGTTEGFRSSPLHLACLNGHPDLAQWLHSVGASLDAINDAGETPLHCACWGGHLDVAQWLHSMGASLDTTDMAGQTPLHHACWMGRLDVAQWLCSAGADATLKINEGSTRRSSCSCMLAIMSSTSRRFAARWPASCGGRKVRCSAPLPQ